MKFHQKIILSGFTVVVLAVFLTTARESESPAPGDTAAAPHETPRSQQNSPHVQAPTASADADTETPSQENSPADVRTWLQKNAAGMDSFSEEDRQELDRFTKNLEAKDMKELEKVASSAAQPSNQRVLAVFLLGQSSLGAGALTTFLQKEIPLHPQAPAHSLEEVANGREKALRVMALEELIKSAPTPAEAKKRLAALIPSLKDPWLKAFAQRKLQSL